MGNVSCCDKQCFCVVVYDGPPEDLPYGKDAWHDSIVYARVPDDSDRFLEDQHDAGRVEATTHPQGQLQRKLTASTFRSFDADDTEEGMLQGQHEMTPVMAHMAIHHGISFKDVQDEDVIGRYPHLKQISPSKNASTKEVGAGSVVRSISGSVGKGLSKIMGRQDSDASKNFNGQWVCVETFGLDDFLKAMGIGWAQRMAAGKAPWPTWEFQQTGVDDFVYLNRGVMGELREVFTVGGEEYIFVDGRGQKIISKALWENKALVILRSTPHGKAREERRIDDSDILHFTLQSLEPAHKGIKWGRNFQRKV